jgi:predicted Zn-dependent protease with MMP-like domain
VATAPRTPGRRVRRRDRRGRGLRGQLIPSGLPGARNRAERFDDLVLDAVEHLERRWREDMRPLEFAVEDVPPADPTPWEGNDVPLGRFFPATRDLPPRVVVYRRPVETRSADETDLGDLVQHIVVEQVAHALGMEPERLDPGFDGL